MTLTSHTPEILDYFLQQKSTKGVGKEKKWEGGSTPCISFSKELRKLLVSWMLKQFHCIIFFFCCCCRMSQGGLVWPWAASAAQQGSRCLQAPLYWICKTKTFKLAEGHLKSLQRFSELIWAALSRICASAWGKIKNKVFDRMLSPFNPSHAKGSISWALQTV